MPVFSSSSSSSEWVFASYVWNCSHKWGRRKMNHFKRILRELDTSNNYNIRIETVKFTYKHTIMLLFFENFYKFAIFKYHVMNTNPKTQFLSDFAFPQKIIFIYYVFTILINTIDTTQWVRIDFSNSLWIFLQIEDINVLNSSTEKWIFDSNLNITWI